MFYGWVVVGVAFLTIMSSMGVWYSFSIYYIEILNEFGWSRAGTAGVFLVYSTVHGLASPLVGFAVQRWGSRAVITAGNLVMVLGLVLSSRTSQVWHLFVFYGCIVALGGSAQGYPPNTSIIANWFHRRRGIAMGIAFAGNGAGIFAFPKLSQVLIDAYGWRNAYLSLTLIFLLLVLPINLIFSRFRPEDKGLRPDGLAEPEPPPQAEPQTPQPIVQTAAPSWTLPMAYRSSEFWLMNAAYAFTSFSILLVMIHQFAFFTDIGLTRGFAAGLISAVGIAMVFGQLICGVICDRYGSEIAYTLSGALIIVGLLLLVQVSQAHFLGGLYLYPLLFGLGAGGVGMVVAVAVADIFHGPQFPAIVGYTSFGWGVGAGLGPIVAGWIYDLTQSYLNAFLIGILVTLAAISTVWIAAPRTYRRLRQPQRL